MLLMKAVFAPRPLVLASVSSPSSSRGGARRCDVIRAQSSSPSATTPPTKKKGKKGLKKTQKQPQQQQPGGGGASSSSSSAVVQKAVAEVAKKKEEDDGPQIPFGDASGAALLLKDVFLAVADTDLLQEANAQIMSGQKNRPRRRERVREIDVTEVHRRRALDSRRGNHHQLKIERGILRANRGERIDEDGVRRSEGEDDEVE